MDTKRIYRGKDIEMLIVLSVLVGYALQNLAFLSTKRSNWDQKFFDNLLAKIDAVVKKHTGYDSALSLRNATKVVTNIMKPAYRALSEFKVQVEQDFKKEKDFLKEILNSLGFQDHFAALNSGDQEAMIQHLYKFSNNITPAQKTTIISKGMMPTLIDEIIAYTDQLTKANISQEQIKGTRTEVTGQRVTDLNNIYNEVIGISQMAHRFYVGNPVLQDQFNYTHNLKNINHHINPKDPPPPPANK
jgi:hypothetical protein